MRPLFDSGDTGAQWPVLILPAVRAGEFLPRILGKATPPRLRHLQTSELKFRRGTRGALIGRHEEWHHMKNVVLNFWNDESGATAIEYGLIAAGIAIAIITAVQGVGTKLNTNFGNISTSLK